MYVHKDTYVYTCVYIYIISIYLDVPPVLKEASFFSPPLKASSSPSLPSFGAPEAPRRSPSREARSGGAPGRSRGSSGKLRQPPGASYRRIHVGSTWRPGAAIYKYRCKKLNTNTHVNMTTDMYIYVCAERDMYVCKYTGIRRGPRYGYRNSDKGIDIWIKI